MYQNLIYTYLLTLLVFLYTFCILLFFCFDDPDKSFKYRGWTAVSASVGNAVEKRVFPSCSVGADCAWCHARGISSDLAEIPESCTNQ